jgi:hypothetical protein
MKMLFFVPAGRQANVSQTGHVQYQLLDAF